MRDSIIVDEFIKISKESESISKTARLSLLRYLMRKFKEIPDKDVPMMVTDESGDCPACHADEFYTMYDMMDSDHYNYCANCGQRLDWTEYNKRIGLHIIKLEKKDNDDQ